jgi:hypothetical protein
MENTLWTCAGRRELEKEEEKVDKGHITRGRYFKIRKVREYKAKECRNKFNSYHGRNKEKRKATEKMVR